uniref:NADH-ubiquinone oxidoreductase chain 3 n=1 Tax=Lepidozona coreanica TaxID=55527 RepID=A0A6G9DVL7_9MOLL|nr:NADH dehydrogenase subunit 3 [Lepidozona coreanica]QIP53377.1 NADH dehydrogenase subunit 3 [Lepidozona coreanica]
MVLLYMIFMFNIALSFLLLLLALYLTKKKNLSREKNSPFECGFDPKNSSRAPFSMRFFLITVIFLVFDVEIILLLPYLVSSGLSSDIFSLAGSLTVVLILTMGTVHEWAQGSLYWSMKNE